MFGLTGVETFWVVIGLAVLAVVVMYGYRYWRPKARKERVAQEVADKRTAEQQFKAAVEAKLIDKDGNPLCVTCNDGKTIATEFDYKTVQTEGLWRWVCMTFFGAVSRYRIVRDIYSAPKYCRDCRVIVERKDDETLSRLAEDEKARQEQIAITLRRYVRTGRDDAIRAELDAHDREAKRLAARPPAPVVPIKSANGL